MVLSIYFLHISGALVLAPLLGFYVISRNPYHKVGRALFAVLMLTAVRSALNLCLQFSPDEGMATVFGQLTIIATILLFGSMLFLASYLPYSRHSAWPAKHPRPYWAVLVLMAVITSLTLDSVKSTSVGYVLDNSLSVLGFSTINALLAIAAALIALTARQGAKDPSFRRDSILLVIAPLLPVISNLVMMGLEWEQVFMTLSLTTSVIYAFVVLKHQVFMLGTSQRIVPKRDAIEPGGAILIKGRSLDPAFKVFKAEVEQGAHGLVICRTHPDQIVGSLGTPGIPMLWLVTQPGPDRIDPTSLNMLHHAISVFIEKNSPAVILLEGVEYLIVQNSLPKVLRMVYSIHDSVTVAGSKLIVPLDPSALDDRSLALMERDFPLRETGMV